MGKLVVSRGKVTDVDDMSCRDWFKYKKAKYMIWTRRGFQYTFWDLAMDTINKIENTIKIFKKCP